jgi:hypothetical protein
MARLYKRGGSPWEAQIWAIQNEAEMQRGSFIFRNPAEDLKIWQLIERFTVEVSHSHKGHLKEVAPMRHKAKCRVWDRRSRHTCQHDLVLLRDVGMGTDPVMEIHGIVKGVVLCLIATT